MKKILLILFCMILLVGTVSALDILPTKQYDEDTKIVTIVNTLGLGRDISTIQLNTPLVYKVGAGYNKVAEFTINSFDDTYSDAFEDMEFFDLRDNEKKFERDFDYKYKTIELIDVNDYKTICESKVSLNGTIYEDCHKEIIGTHQEEKEVWKDLDTKILYKGEITVGVFTEVQINDYVEWIPTLFGKEIDEWASWTADLNTGLVSYYKFDEQDTTGTGTIKDELGTNNGTNNETISVAGKINTAYDFNESDSIGILDSGSLSFSPGTDSYSFQSWIYMDANGKTMTIASDTYTSYDDWSYWLRVGNDNTLQLFAYDVGGILSSFDINPAGTLSTGQWYHVAFTVNTTKARLYLNGTLVAEDDVLNFTISKENGAVIGSHYGGSGLATFFDGKIDEPAFWGRQLTDAEIVQLYNGGSGISYEFSGPIVNLNSPTDNLNTTNPIITFNATASDDINLINVNFILNNIYNSTNSSGLNNSYYINTLTLADGDYNWTYEACDNESQCKNATVRSFTLARYFENSKSSNDFSYETEDETFTINFTTDGTSPTAIFLYNSTNKGAATITSLGDNNFNISKTITVPLGVGNNTWYFNVTIDGITSSSTSYQQSISETVFTNCNATYSTVFLNLTFKNETQNAFISASIPTSTFEYWLGSGTVNKSYSYTSTSNHTNYTFCSSVGSNTLNVDPYIQYKQSPNYPQRVYDSSAITYTNANTNLTLYLLQVSNGIYVTFQVINSANQVISGVEVNAVRTINGGNVNVGTGTTGADGGVTLWLNPDFVHTFTFSKSGLTTYSTSFAPTQTAYTITMGGVKEVSDSHFKGIDYSLLPTNTSLTNDTSYTFGFNLTSSFWDLDEYGFDLRLVNGTELSGGSTSTSGTLLTLNYNTTNQSKMYLDYYWKINSTYTNRTVEWKVYSTLYTQWSIFTFKNDLILYLDSGFFGIDDFGRNLIIFILIFFIAGIVSYKFGFTNPLAVSTIIFLTCFFLETVIGIIPPYTLRSGKEITSMLTFLSGLVLAMLIFREAKRWN